MVDEAKYGTFVGVVAQIIDDMNVIIKKRNKMVAPVNTRNGFINLKYLSRNSLRQHGNECNLC